MSNKRVLINCLGNTSYRLGEESVKVPTSKMQALLIYLCMADGKSFSREALAEFLWKGKTLDRALHSLSQALYALRRIFPSLEWQVTPQTVKLLRTNFVLDVHELTDSVKRGDVLRALTLYSPDFLDGLIVNDSPAFDHWADAQRAQIREAIESLTAHYLSKTESEGKWGDLIKIAELAVVRGIAAERVIPAGLLAALNLEHAGLIDEWLKRSNDAKEKSPGLRRLQDLAARFDSSEPVQGFSPKFVGRIQEFEQLADNLSTVERGKGCATVIVGDPGTGKSRLAERVLRYATLRGFAVFRSKAFASEARLPYGCVLEALSEKTMQHPLVSQSEFLSQAFSFPTQFASGISSEADRVRVFYSILDSLRESVKSRPGILFIDDFQWADESSHAFIHFLARHAAQFPLFVLISTRTAPSKIDADNFQVIRLANLSEPDTNTLAQQLADEFCLSMTDDQRSIVYRSSGGNPFLIVEFLKGVKDGFFDLSGRSSRESWRTIVPEGILDHFRLQLETLTSENQRILNALSILLRTARLDVLAAVAQEDIGRVPEIVSTLIRIGIVRNDGATLMFVHDLYRDAVYARMTPWEKGLRHRVAATSLKSIPGTHDGIVAMHYYHAVDKPECRKHALLAAEFAEKVHALEDLEFFLDLAIETSSGAEKLEALYALSLILVRWRRYSDAERTLDKLLHVAHSEQSRTFTVRGKSQKARIYARSGRYTPAAKAYLLDAVAHCRDCDDTEALIWALTAITTWSFEAADFQEAHRAANELRERALAFPSTEVFLEGITISGMTLACVGDVSKSGELFDIAIEKAVEVGSTAAQIRGLICRASFLYRLGNLMQAKLDFERAWDLTRGEDQHYLYGLNNYAVLLTEFGEFERAIILLDKAKNTAVQQAAKSDALFALANRLLLNLDLLSLDHADQDIAELLELGSDAQPGWFNALRYTYSGMLALKAHRTEEAVIARQFVLDGLAQLAVQKDDYSWSHIFVARSLVAEGKLSSAVEYIEETLSSSLNGDFCCRLRLEIERARLLCIERPSEALAVAKRTLDLARQSHAITAAIKAQEIVDRAEYLCSKLSPENSTRRRSA